MKYAKSPQGQAAFAQRTNAISPRQRMAFILFDGARDTQEILAMTQGAGVTPDDLQHLIDLGFLEAVGPAASAPAVHDAPPAPRTDAPAAVALTEQQRYQLAYPLATQLTATLGLRGFRLNLAVESAQGLQDLVRLYPRIAEAAGQDKARALAAALGLERAGQP